MANRMQLERRSVVLHLEVNHLHSHTMSNSGGHSCEDLSRVFPGSCSSVVTEALGL